MENNNENYEYIGKAIATLASALVCGTFVIMTGGSGSDGIAWFILSLLFIW